MIIYHDILKKLSASILLSSKLSCATLHFLVRFSDFSLLAETNGLRIMLFFAGACGCRMFFYFLGGVTNCSGFFCFFKHYSSISHFLVFHEATLCVFEGLVDGGSGVGGRGWIKT